MTDNANKYNFEQWAGFKGNQWRNSIDLRDFIVSNYSEYTGDESFLTPPTARTIALNEKYEALHRQEIAQNGVLSVDTEVVSSLLTYAPGYLDKETEIIVGLQTSKPLERGVNPFGGMRMAKQACEAYGYKLSDKIENEFRYKSTHNDGVFRTYTPEMKMARHCGIITGLPDAYGRGRIVGDYRRVALYGTDLLIAQKQEDKLEVCKQAMTEENIRLSEELFKQIDFLKKLDAMAKMYGKDVSKPASNAKEATQGVYFAYLAAIKEQNGAAMSLGRTSTFLDIYFRRDIENGVLKEQDAQEIIDDFVLKLRMSRQLRTPEYNDLFAGDPTWVTESIGGMCTNGKSMVTKNSFRMLNTLFNLNPAPEPNLTILWSQKLPQAFKEFCSKVSAKTDSLQYENDDLMREIYGDDYAIACCVSAAQVGKQMQFFGARCNLAKTLLMALNGGKDEITGNQVGPKGEVFPCEVLDYDKVYAAFSKYRSWLCELYVNTMNIIHFMHDKYAYEKIQMALHDTNVHHFMSFGMSGLSVVADSFSAIKYAKVTPIKNENGIICDFEVQGDFPKYGNDDDRVDMIAKAMCDELIDELRKHKAYKNAEHTLSILTITSNVVYGKKTGSTPDGRKGGEPFAPGANPMHGRETSGALASLNSVAKIDYNNCRDGISNTFTITPTALGSSEDERTKNLVSIIDGYFAQNAHHLNVNVLNRDTLLDAMEHPEKYPNLTIRVSGYAVNFIRLNKNQQQEVISRTFFEQV